MKKALAILLSVLLLMAAVPLGVMPVAATSGDSATIDFGDKANRVSYSTEQQVWAQNGITVTNDKAASLSNVGDYGGDGYPVRFYKDSSVTVEYPGMTRIEFHCNDYKDTYPTDLQASITEGSVMVDGTTVTVTLDAPTDFFYIAQLVAQVRIHSITVYTGNANLITNGDFETGDASGWETWQSTSISADAAKDGAFGAHLVGNGGWGGLLNRTLTVEPGKQYKLSFWINVNAMGVNVQVKNGAGASIEGAGGWFDGNNKDKLVEWVFTATDNSVLINFCGGGNGVAENVYVDNFSLVALGDTPDAPVDDALVKNGSFETGDLTNWINLWDGCTVEFVEGYESANAISITAGSWSQIRQSGIKVEPNTDYVLSINHKYAENFGLIVKDGNDSTDMATLQLSSSSWWMNNTLEFNSGDQTEICVLLIGWYGGGDAIIDNVVLTKKDEYVQPNTPEPPQADSKLSIAETIMLALSQEHNVYTTDKYYVTGVIVEVYNDMYGNMRLTDDAGNILTIYSSYNADGSVRYDAMDAKPVAGDTVTIYGIVGHYNGTPQIKNGWIVDVVHHNHVYDGPGDPYCNGCGELREKDSIELNTDIRFTQDAELLFIPEVSGTYAFTSPSDYYVERRGYICDIDGNVLQSTSWSYYGFSMEYNFVAGTPYILRSDVYYNYYDYEYTVCVSLLQDGLQYKLKDGKATITGYRGEMPADLVIPDTIDGYSVTAIAFEAFYDCDNLQSVTIGDSVTSIGSYAFYDCDNLRSMTIGDSVTSIGSYAFSYCYNLQSVTIPDSITEIGRYAFVGCTNLQSVYISDSVTSIGSYAFSYCYNLQSVYISDIAAWCNISFPDAYANPLYQGASLYLNGNRVTHLEIPEGVTSIKDYAFFSCDSLWSVTLPDSVTSISSCAFYDCDNLQSVTIGDSVTSIGSYAFYDCNNLQSVTIPDSVTSIGSYAFSYCYNLQSVTIPSSVTSIGSYAFSGCTNLQAVYISDIAAWCNISFPDAYANPLYQGASLYLNGQRVMHLEIPEGVTAIKNFAFYNCDSLWSVTLPDSVTSIGAFAFYDCYYLQSINIPDGVTSIGNSAFRDCFSLQTLILPDSVTSLGEDAFHSCFHLQSVTLGDGLTTIPEKAFRSCEMLTSVIISDNVTSIGRYAFYNCGNLTSIFLPVSVTYIDDYAFGYCNRLSDVYYAGSQDDRWNIYISSYSYWDDDNTHLTDAFWHYDACMHQYNNVCDADCNVCGAVRQPEHLYDADCEDATCNLCGAVRDVPTHTYDDSYDADCNLCGAIRELESIKIDEDIRINITEPGQQVKLPFTPKESGYYQFAFSTSVDYIIYDAQGHRIDWDGWRSETEVYLSAGMRYYLQVEYSYEDDIGSFTLRVSYSEQRYFRYLYTVNNEQATITGWKGTISDELVIPAAIDGYPVVAIGEGAFSNTGIASVIIPDGVTTIGYSAFSGCFNLTSVIIPDGVTTIGNSAFSGCDNLTSVSLPVSVTTIGDRAFQSCYWLTDIYYTGDEAGRWNIAVGEYNERIYEATWHYNACIHIYENTCDETCNKCGAVREDAHSYLSACDRDCNLCGTVRQAPHVYDGVCDATCNACGMRRNAQAHTYDNACDTVCNGCGAERRVPPHMYDDACDADCNVCGEKRNDIHVYDHICDPYCNVCGALRHVEGHSFDSACDATCDKCGFVRQVPNHLYSDTCDIDCNVCGEYRTPPHSFSNSIDTICNVCGMVRDLGGNATDSPIFVVDNATAQVGDTFTVAIRTKNNPGLVSFKLNVRYDTWQLELISYEEGDFAGLSYGPSWKRPFVVNWCDTVHADNTTNGTVVLLTFRVRDNADIGDTGIYLSYDDVDVFNAAWETVYFQTQSGTITILEPPYGDLDGDGAINNRDFGWIQQYLNGWDVDINTAAADVNGDGVLNNRDLGLIQRYLNGWDVELGR